MLSSAARDPMAELIAPDYRKQLFERWCIRVDALQARGMSRAEHHQGARHAPLCCIDQRRAVRHGCGIQRRRSANVGAHERMMSLPRAEWRLRRR